jgi:hypothetical protein
MKNLMYILALALTVACGSGQNQPATAEVSQPVTGIRVGADCVPYNQVAYVFKSLIFLNGALKTVKADDKEGFESIVFDRHRTMIVTDTIRMRIYETHPEFVEVKIINGIHAGQMGYVVNEMIKPAE